MRSGICGILRDVGHVLVAGLAMVCLTGLSFLITCGFGYRAYSDRLVWAGTIVTALGGLGGILATAKGSVERYARSASAPQEEASSDGSAPADRRRSAPRFGLPLRIWAAGVLCIVAGIALDLLVG